MIEWEGQCDLQPLDFAVVPAEEHHEAISRQQEACQTVLETAESEAQCSILASDLRERVLAQLTPMLTALSLLRAQQHDILEGLEQLQGFNLEEVFRAVFEDSQAARLRALQGSI